MRLTPLFDKTTPLFFTPPKTPHRPPITPPLVSPTLAGDVIDASLLRLVAAERMTIFVQSRRYWRPPKQISTSVRRRFLHYVEAQCTPDHGKISPPVASPRKRQRSIFKPSDRWHPSPTVAPHINLCESAHKNKKSKHNNQPNASSRSRCRRPYPRRGECPSIGPPAADGGAKKVSSYHAYCLCYFNSILHQPNVVCFTTAAG